MGVILRRPCGNALRIFSAIAVLAAGCLPVFARDASLDYSVSNAGRYCELRVGEKVPKNVVLRRTYRQYVESGSYNVIRVYGACGGRVPVEVLRVLERDIVSDIIIKRRGVCVDGRVCIGDSLAAARKALPSAKTFVLYEEGQVLYMRLSPYVTLGVEVSDVELSCPEIPTDRCLRRVLSRKIGDITISNRIHP